jgi:TetR/AcrR family transcriptional repressor of nem operon
MAGVKRFDKDEVLDRAMRLFWERGYEATSIDDLLKATGINRGSLYGTFGDKRRLFLAAVDRYMEKVGLPLFKELAHGNPRDAMRRMFKSIIRRNSDGKSPAGCLITNSAVECRRLGGAINVRIERELKLQESAILETLRRASVMNLLGPKHDLRALARFFLGVAQGLNVVSQAGGRPTMLRSMAKVAMSVWPPQHALREGRFKRWNYPQAPRPRTPNRGYRRCGL